MVELELSENLSEIPQAGEVSLTDLSASLYGHEITFEAMIVGESSLKALPESITVECPVCGEQSYSLYEASNWKMLSDYLFNPAGLRVELRSLHSHSKTPVKILESEAKMDYQEAWLEPIETREKFSETSCKPLKVHFIDVRIPLEKRVKARGVVALDRDRRLTVLVYEIEPLNDYWSIQFTKEDHETFKRYFTAEDIRERIDKTLATHIVGRAASKLALALCLHSPLSFRFKGREVWGILRGIFLGTTTTGKSEVASDPKRTFNLGETVGAEISRVTGLIGTVDLDSKSIIWGVVPRADKEFLALDGLQKISPEEIAMLREALRKLKAEIVKSVRGSAPCRTRIVATLNPPRALEEYVFRAEAVRDSYPFRDPVDITRWDLFIPFSKDDVPAEEIANSYRTEPQIPAEIFRKHILWAWNLKPEEIYITPEAEESIKRNYLALSEHSLSELPLINADTLNTLAKLSVAFAILTHDVDNDGKVVVREEHVNHAVGFFREILEKWEYFNYVDYVLQRKRLTQDEILAIEREFQDDGAVRRIFLEITKQQGIEASTLTEKLRLSKQWIISEVSKLKNLELVESQERRKGYWLTPKGISYARILKEREVAGQLLDQTLPVDQKKEYTPSGQEGTPIC